MYCKSTRFLICHYFTTIDHLLFLIACETPTLIFYKSCLKRNKRVIDLLLHFRKCITKLKTQIRAMKRLSVSPLSEAAQLENVIPEMISSTVLTTRWRYQDVPRGPAVVTLTCVILHQKWMWIHFYMSFFAVCLFLFFQILIKQWRIFYKTDIQSNILSMYLRCLYNILWKIFH